jgi:hypothetical protein
MSYPNYYYLPQPPREWSRVENSCPTYNNYYEAQMIKKGNILQYKKNSGNLTNAQLYSRIAKGQWVNRNTTWSNQSTRGYTNPNTNSLKRVGATNIAIDPITGQILGPTIEPITCPQPINNIYNNLPTTQPSSTSEPPVPPPPPPAPPSGPTVPPVPQPIDIGPIVIQDGGNLICSVVENICTGETSETLSNQVCNLTTDSDVPGPIEPLCWDGTKATWYPKQRYTMTNSTNKWPYSSGNPKPVFNSALKPIPPVLSLTSINDCNNYTYQSGIITNSVFLSWTFENNICIPISSFKLYQTVNGITNLIKIIPFPISLTEITNVLSCTNYTFYITALSNNAESDKSNEVSVFIRALCPTTITSITAGCETATLTWIEPNISCINITAYYVYQNGIKIATLAPNVLTYTATGLTTCTDYDYNISYFDSISGQESYLSNTATISELPCPPIIQSITFDYTTNSQNLSFNSPVSSCIFNYYNLYQTITPTNSYIVPIPFTYPGIYNLTAANLQNNASKGEHTFYMTSFSNTNMTESQSSNVFSIPPPPINLSGHYTATPGQIQLYWNNQNPTTGLTITQNKIYVKNLTLGGYTTYLIIPSSSYLLIGLTPSNSYEISVTEIASSNSTESILSNSITMIPSINTISLVITSFSGNYTSGINGPITWYKFVLSGTTTSSGIVQLISSITNPTCQINFCIIGGGDSGGGNNIGTQFNYGGGGGGIYYSTGVTVNTFTNFTLQVGQAGLNSNSGIFSRIQSPTSSILSSYISTGASQTIAGSGNYNGGNGGAIVSPTGQNGSNSSFYTLIGNFSGPDGNTYTLGGGGGTTASFIGGLLGGGLAGNGIGGTAGGMVPNFNGQNASANSNNFGGGGGGCVFNGLVPYRPGDGNPGSVFIWWTTIQ